MIAVERSVAVLLCGGHSRRFALGDKLLHPLGSRPVVDHSAALLASLPFVARIATVRPNAPELHRLLRQAGFDLVELDENADQRQSICAGLNAAFAAGPEAICLALGDMPYISRGHFEALAAAASADRPAISMGEGWTGPPWFAPVNWLRVHRKSLKDALIRDAIPVAPPIAELRDIDSVADLPE